MKTKKPSDYSKFYNFEISPTRLKEFQGKLKYMSFKHLRNAFIFGFAIEYMVIKTQICEFC